MIAGALISAATNRGLRNWTDDEIGFLADTVERAKPDFIAEWGTNTGESAWLFYHAAKLAGLRRCVIHSIDISDGLAVCYPEDEGRLRGDLVATLPVILHVGDGVTVGLREYASSGRDEPLFFLDGNHDVGQVLREMTVIADAAPHAIMLLHDTNGDPGIAFGKFVGSHPDLYLCDIHESPHGLVAMWPR